MLSAVAARKAAKAAAQTSSTPFSNPPPPPPQSKSPSPPLQQPLVQPTSKRKPASPRRPSNNKKVKVIHAPASRGRNARYFHPTELSDASSGDEGSNGFEAHDPTRTHAGIESSSESESSSGDVEIETNVPPPAGFTSVPVTKTRHAWSPSRPIQDSSDEDEPGPSAPFGPNLTPATSARPELPLLSTFHPTLGHNVYPVAQDEYATSGNTCILVFQRNETLALAGMYSLCVLHGSVSLLGVTLSPSNTKHVVFAPRSSPIPILSWVKSDRQGSCTLPIPSVIRQQSETTAVLVECLDTGVEGLGQICRVFENAFNAPRGSNVISGVDLPRVHIVNHRTMDIHPFVLPSSWEAALVSVDQQRDPEHSAPVYLVKGPKKTGKSTLARMLVNRLLCRYRRVAFLECDLGQSEFTPGGLVALNVVENHLFGPPFTHPSLPYRAHYIGSITPRANPSRYLNSIQSLLETYRLDLQYPALLEDPLPADDRIYDTIPLVVNTMGWNKGLGADLNARIEEFVEASHTFNIEGVEEKGWPSQPSQHIPRSSCLFPYIDTTIKSCVNVEAIQTEATNTYHTATDDRHLNILSYFHAIFPEPPTPSPFGLVLTQVTAIRWNTSLPLCAQYPYEVDYTKAINQVYLTGPGYEDVVPSELTRVLNGAVVGLVSHDPAPRRSASQQMPSLSYTPGEPPPDPVSSRCHGLALIRGVPSQLDPQSPYMHVLTPVPTVLLSQARLFVKGDMELPIWGMLDFRENTEGTVAGVDKAHVPYLQWGKGEGIGSEKRRVRRNVMRKGQM